MITNTMISTTAMQRSASVVHTHGLVMGDVRPQTVSAYAGLAGFGAPTQKRDADWTTPGSEPWSPPVT
jgi:hypothetical protein